MPALRAGILDQFVAIAAESTYGNAPSTFARVVNASNDSWTPEVQEVAADAFRPGRQAVQADQTIQIPVGGSGSIETRIGEGGMFLLMRDLLDQASALASVQNASGMKKLTLKTNSVGPSLATPNSLSVMVGRADVDQARRETIYSGCSVTDWELSGSVGEPVGLTINYDWVKRALNKASSDGSYSPPALSKIFKGRDYTWRDLSIAIGSTTIGTATSFTLSANRGLNIERRYLIGSAAKEQPLRNAIPEYSAMLECDYDAGTAALLQNWGEDGLVGKVVATLTGRTDNKSSGASPVYPSIVFTLGNAKVTGSEPGMDLGGHSTISLELAGVDPGDGYTPAMQIDIIAPQTAID